MCRLKNVFLFWKMVYEGGCCERFFEKALDDFFWRNLRCVYSVIESRIVKTEKMNANERYVRYIRHHENVFSNFFVFLLSLIIR